MARKKQTRRKLHKLGSFDIKAHIIAYNQSMDYIQERYQVHKRAIEVMIVAKESKAGVSATGTDVIFNLSDATLYRHLDSLYSKGYVNMPYRKGERGNKQYYTVSTKGKMIINRFITVYAKIYKENAID